MTSSRPLKTLAQILGETNELLAEARRELSASQDQLRGIKTLNSALDNLRHPTTRHQSEMRS